MNVFTNLELLLSQEMESIKGGVGSGSCTCTTGAAQPGSNSCSCTTAAAQTSDACKCVSGANQPGSLSTPDTCTTATN